MLREEPPEPGDKSKHLIAAFFVSNPHIYPQHTNEEWAKLAKVENLRHTQYGERPRTISVEGMWGGKVYCTFYVACFEQHTCIMVCPFYRTVRDLTSPSENPNTELTKPPTWPLVQLFQETCLSLQAEVMLFSYWPENANLRWVRKQYPVVLTRDPWDISKKDYSLLYMNGNITGQFSPLLQGEGDRDYVEVEGGGVLLFAQHGRDRWVGAT